MSINDDFRMKGTMELGNELREGRETETARLYRQAYRAGWNDALDALSKSACAGCSDEHWLKRALLRQAASMKRR